MTSATLQHVAVGIILKQHQVLIARRPEPKPMAGLWEFPGGKLEPSETVIQALHRELYEELAITILQAKPFMQCTHDYPGLHVLLDVWLVEAFSGTPYGKEQQQFQWVNVESLPTLPFPEANQVIIQTLLQHVAPLTSFSKEHIVLAS